MSIVKTVRAATPRTGIFGMMLGRWKRETWQVYVEQHPECRLQVAQRFMNGSPDG
jgi:hypothetical protein